MHVWYKPNRLKWSQVHDRAMDFAEAEMDNEAEGAGEHDRFWEQPEFDYGDYDLPEIVDIEQHAAGDESAPAVVPEQPDAVLVENLTPIPFGDDTSDDEADGEEQTDPPEQAANNSFFFDSTRRVPWFLKSVVPSSLLAVFTLFAKSVHGCLPARFRAFIYNVPLVIAILVALAFGAKTMSIAEGNRVCLILSFAFSIVGVFFPTTVDEIVDKTSIKDQLQTVGIFGICPKCRKVYSLQNCSVLARDGSRKAILCTYRRFPNHSQKALRAMCGAPLLPLKKNSLNGECELLPSHRDRYLYLGT